MTWTGNTVLRWNGQVVTSQPTVQAFRVDTGALHGTTVQASTAGVATFTDLVDNVGYVCVTYLGAQGFIQSVLQSPANNPIGTGLIYIDNTNHRVGINTASPAQMLDISSTAPSFQMTDTTASAKSLRLVVDADVASFYEAAGAAGDILSLDLTSKRAGIGTTGPMDVLHVNANSAGGVGGRIVVSNLAASTLSNEADLAFKASVDFVATYYSARIASIVTNAGNDSSDLAFFIYRAAGSASGAEVMRLQGSTGNVGINTSSPGALLEVKGAAAGSQVLIGNLVTTTSYAGIGLANSLADANYNFASNTTDTNLYINRPTGKTIEFKEANGTTQVKIKTTGTITMAAYGAGTATFDASGNITSVSDERHKTAIKPFHRGLPDLLNIRPITYKYNELSTMETEHEYTGFSAQNVLKSIPEAVFEKGGIYSFNDRPVLATVVNAIQELDARLTKAGIA